MAKQNENKGDGPIWRTRNCKVSVFNCSLFARTLPDFMKSDEVGNLQ